MCCIVTFMLRNWPCINTHMLHIKYCPMSQMVVAAFHFCLVPPHLACISSHVLPGVKTGTFLGHHAWSKQVGAEGRSTYLNAYSMAMLSTGGSAFTKNVIGFGKLTASYRSTPLKGPQGVSHS